MPTPFPGMDPYLERRGIWEQVHTNLIVDIQRFLTRLLRPRYHVGIEERTYLAVLPPDDQSTGMPDVLIAAPPSSPGGVTPSVAVAAPVAVAPVVAQLPMPEEVKERYLEIRTVPDQEVITIIEILSPTNKTTREGREQYESKRLKVLGSLTHLVEIDLLRIGQPFPMKVPGQGDYRLVVSRSRRRPYADVYLFSVRDLIPDLPIPLRPGEEEPTLPLNKILHEVYDQGGYDLIMDYQKSPEPPLSEADAAWAAQILAEV
ncbi:MAG: DUF4058 family protein [Chloroflexi bacterium]|nr:DUF4058 family protein [Chloroflexota bacterium]